MRLSLHLLALATLATPAGSAVVPAAPLIPREAFFGNPVATQGRISPDGKWLSWLAPHKGVMNIWIAPIDGPSQARAVTTELKRPIRQYLWAPNSRSLLFLNDVAGDENLRLYQVVISTGEQKALTPLGARSAIIATSPHVKDQILVGHNQRDPKWSDVYNLELATGRLTLLLRNEGFAGFLADRKLRLRLAQKNLPGGNSQIFRLNGGLPGATPFATVPFEDSRTSGPVRLSGDARTVYWIDTRGRDTAALVAEELGTGKKRILGEDRRADVGGTLYHPVTGRPDAYAVNYQKNEWRPLNSDMRRSMEFLHSRLRGEIQILSRDDRDRRWIVTADPVTGPLRAFVYDRSKRTLTSLYTSQPALADAKLAPVHPLEIPSRDGLRLVSYLTLPVGSDANADGLPEEPLPTVLLVHGGPWLRDSYGFNARAQWLANRGYAVLATNFRGSSGFGKKFLGAGDREWGRAMHNDLLDVASWAERNRISAPGKTAIMGHSYGGYAALAALAFTPDVFACGIDTAGSSNLETLLKGTPATWEAEKEQLFRRMGDPRSPEGLASLRARSPLYKADQIRRPLLIGQGANDPRVPRAEPDQIVAAMQRRGLPVTYLVFPDEGHNFARPENVLAFNAVAEQFLSRCLGGRVEPYGTALQSTSMIVEAEGPQTPGLRELVRSQPRNDAISGAK
jgi:dipeptidyl aminopeptidase/acylaminoacyl peptidase